jgi:pSer/pThr/pTyr-binding forkhead associated (FHA) protein
LGVRVSWDAALQSRETFDSVIVGTLPEAAAVVVLWSPRSVASRWVRAEATQADRRNKLAPAIIEPCDRPIIFELTHAADLCDWTGDITDLRWRTFVDDLKHLIEARAGEDGHAATHAPKPTPADRVAAHSRVSAPERKPLRPGNDEIIFAGGEERRSVPRPTPVKQASPREVDHQSDVHVLELFDDDLGEMTLIVDSPSVKVGRLAPADLVIPDKSISREHCIIALASDELLVTDLNSTNGTYVDGERITRATILPVGSLLQLGKVMLTHVVRPAGEDETAAPAARLAS